MAIYNSRGEEISTYGTKLAGRSAIAFGDSITQYQGNNLFQYAVSLYGLSTFRNEGHAGTTWGDAKGHVNDVIVANADMTTLLNDTYDIITLAYGTNSDTTLGTVNDTIETASMCGYCKWCIENLLYYCRSSKIGGIIPPQRAENNAYQKTKNALIREIYENYSIPYLDLEKASQIVPDNVNSVATALGKSQYYLGDGLHLGGNGNELYQYKYAEFIANLL